ATTAVKLAREGANVVVNYPFLEEKENAQQVVEQIRKLKRKAVMIEANVADPEACKKLINDTLEAFDKIDILINNAGITRDKLLLRMKEKDWDEVLEVNLKGVFNCTRAVTRQMMKQRSGRIINLASVVGLTGNPGQANYAASKAGVIGFTRSVARELGSRGINVNAVAPGFIESKMTEQLSDSVKEEMLNSIPLGKFGTPGDVADLICFLASEKAKYITGQVINVDGGMVT
ncbi:MAG: 3-oxoacyl-[acyl-carrier-protein] reductase, partial [Bacillota bacterium]